MVIQNRSGLKKWGRRFALGITALFMLTTSSWAADQDIVAQEHVILPAEEQTETTPTKEPQASSVEGGFTPINPSETIEEEAPPKGLEEIVSLDLRNIEVADALRFLAMKGGLNLSISKTVSGRLYLLLNNVPIRDILDIILRSNALAYDTQGDIYNIMTEGEYKTRYGRSFSDARQVKIFQLKYAIPERVFSALDALKSEVGKMLVDQESGMVLVIDTEQSMAKIEDAINSLEQKRNIKVFQLQYAKAKDVEERLKTQLDAKGVGSVISDERSNQLVVQTFPERMDAIGELIKSLDQKTKEVLIVSKIIKVTISDDLAAEVKWEGLFKQMNPIGFLKEGNDNPKSFIGNHPSSNLARNGTSFIDDFISITPTTRPTAGSKNTLTENLIFGQLGEDNIEVLLNLLKTIGSTKVLSSPRISVVNNQEAKIHVGENQAYVTTTTTTAQTGNTIAENVTFVKIGIELSVTPTINDEGFVTLKIKPSISSVTSTLTTPSGNKIPIIDTSEAETTVMVKDKTSIVIAGLRKDDLVNSDKRVPILGDIPVMGILFRSVTKNKDRTELLILLTPHIVEGTRLITGEPDPVITSLKGYRDYAAVAIKPAGKPDQLKPASNPFKEVAFATHE